MNQDFVQRDAGGYRGRKWIYRAVGLLASSFFALGVGAVGAPEAWAIAQDARDACGVVNSDEVNGTAEVPVDLQGDFFINAPSERDPAPILRGNGRTAGAVHIEVKHRFSDWNEAVTAISKAVDRGVVTVGSDRNTYVWTFAPGKTLTVVIGDFSVIAAYPNVSTEEYWTEAAASQAP